MLFEAPGATSDPGFFEIWDVFSSERLQGNSLAVFPDAKQLPEAQLGAIAREMAHSETAFVYPRDPATEDRDGVRVRIFSRAGKEMPFAGHPVLGTAFSCWARTPGDAVTLSVPAGRVRVTFRETQSGAWEGEMTQPDPIFAEIHHRERLADLLGISVDDFDPALPVQNVSTGRPNILVLLRSQEAVARVNVDWRGLTAYLADGDGERGIYLLTRDVEQAGVRFHARKPGRTGDDPVTGSAAGCAIAAVVQHGMAQPGERVVIEQASEIGRGGELFASAELFHGGVTNVRVGGQAVCSARGALVL